MKTLTNKEIASKNKLIKALRFSKKGDKNRADSLKALRDENLITTVEAKAKPGSDTVTKNRKELSSDELVIQRNLAETRIASVNTKDLTVSEELLINHELVRLEKILDAQDEEGIDTKDGRALISDTNINIGKKDLGIMEVKKASKTNTRIISSKKTGKDTARKEAEAKARKEAAEAEEARMAAEEAQKIADELKAKAEKEAEEAKEAEGKLEEEKKEDKGEGK